MDGQIRNRAQAQRSLHERQRQQLEQPQPQPGGSHAPGARPACTRGRFHRAWSLADAAAARDCRQLKTLSPCTQHGGVVKLLGTQAESSPERTCTVLARHPPDHHASESLDNGFQFATAQKWRCGLTRRRQTRPVRLAGKSAALRSCYPAQKQQNFMCVMNAAIDVARYADPENHWFSMPYPFAVMYSPTLAAAYPA